jgi:hypothetical protein
MKNMRVFIKLVLCGFILVSASGCDDEKDAKQPAKIDGEAMRENFDAHVDELTQEFSISAVDGGMVTGDQGTKVIFYPNAFLTQSGTPVTGEVKIELVEIFKKSDMLLSRKPTNGKKPDGTVSTLISGGEFFINATQNGNQLKPANGFYLSTPVENTGEADHEMFLFDGVETCEGDDCRLEWKQQEQGGVEVVKRDGQGGASGMTTEYMAFQSKFGWTNIDKWYSDPRPKTSIFVDVPEGYDNTNCAVYLSYDGEPTALASFDVYNEGTGLFTEHYGLIPIGLEVHFIFVSVVDGEWNYAIQSATITANHVQVISNVQSVTEAQLEDLIDDLP